MNAHLTRLLALPVPLHTKLQFLEGTLFNSRYQRRHLTKLWDALLLANAERIHMTRRDGATSPKASPSMPFQKNTVDLNGRLGNHKGRRKGKAVV